MPDRSGTRRPRVVYRQQNHGWRGRPLFAALGMRQAYAQHSEPEGELLRRYVSGRSTVVEIGVAEGGSAWEAARVMSSSAHLYLIDPYFDRSVRGLSAAKITARRAVNSVAQARVEWIEKFSHEAVTGWTTPIDFLFIDGDHTYEGVRRDWKDWTPHLAPGGLVALHDAHPDGPWTEPDHGPVRLFSELREDPSWRLVDHVDTLVVLERRDT